MSVSNEREAWITEQKAQRMDDNIGVHITSDEYGQDLRDAMACADQHRDKCYCCTPDCQMDGYGCRAITAPPPREGISVKEAALLVDAVNDESLSDAVFRIVVTDLVKGLEKPTKEDMEWAREQLAKQTAPTNNVTLRQALEKLLSAVLVWIDYGEGGRLPKNNPVITQAHVALATPPAKVLVDAIRKVEEDEFGYRHIEIAVNNASEGDTVRVRVTEEKVTK